MPSTETFTSHDLVHDLSILFVDDDEQAREHMARYLGRHAGKVLTATDGRHALDVFQEYAPDLVISDIRMAGMDGLTMCRKIRESAPAQPVIFISAHNESDVLLTSIDLGVTKFIVKPVDMNELMNAIGSVAKSLVEQRSLENRIQQMASALSEADFASESIREYVSNCLEPERIAGFPQVRYLNLPKLAVSGDFYSVASYQDDLYVMLADGAGHGLSAVMPALQMPKLFQRNAERGFSLLRMASDMNSLLREQHFPGHFVATTLLRINPVEGYIEVLNCGNPPVWIFSGSGALVSCSHSKSPPLGIADGEDDFDFEHLRLEGDARILLYTDGLADTIRAASPEFPVDELQKAVQEHAAPLFDSLSALVRDAGPSSRFDDVTMLEIRYERPQQVDRPSGHSQATPQDKDSGADVALDQMTMLYVEDDELTRESLAHFLRRRFGMLYTAADGEEGVNLFRKHHPDIVLADIKMPVMDGLEMAEQIRQIDSEVPIIMTSGSDNAQDAERMFDMGIARFHSKPMDTAKLIGAIQASIRHSRALGELRMSASLFNSSALAVVTTNHDKQIIAVNPAFTRITGYTLAELSGHRPTLLSSGQHDAAFFQSMWRALDDAGNWAGELRCKFKNGEAVSTWLTINAIPGERGEPSGYHFVFSDASERQVHEAQLRQLSDHDSLTRLPNRRAFAEKMGQLLRQASLRDESWALIYINIDSFIEINNVLGMRVGDEVLIAIAQRIEQNVHEHGLTCRLGGDEFAVALPSAGLGMSVEQAVIELASAINQPIEVGGQPIQLRVSIGIGQHPGDGGNYDELLQSACNAMHEAQRKGGGTYRFFDRAISQREERQVLLQQGIKQGLHHNEFYMLYQPKYSLSRKRVVGAEALIRWQHPVLGSVSPVEFIPLAESNGTVIEMSEWIVETVCAQLANWRNRGRPLVPVSVNISPVHFWRGDLVSTLQYGLQKWGLPPDLMPIEVTEGVVMDASENTLQVLSRLKSLGFHLSIDDFGTGYSSLKYLKDLPVSELKIDQSFVRELPESLSVENLSRTAIPRAIIQLAAELSLSVVAEGVETEGQKQFLFEHGCDVIQGYLISKPVSAEMFESMLSV